ncbi:MAG: hypothetical protein ACI39G_04685 [Pseudoramibacter sp.]
MKKIINNKRYNTETAKFVEEYEYSNKTDFHWYDESLYQKRTGEFFLAGEGHAASKYFERCADGMRGPGCDIIPLTYEEARQWGEDHMNPDDYEEVFGPADEGSTDERQTVSLSLPLAMIAKLRTEAGKQEMTMSDVVAKLIEKM